MLTKMQKAGWGLADLGVAMFNIVKQLLVFAFLTTQLGVPVDVAGRVTAAVLLFDMLTDPLMGWISDRTSSRWGRRAPWMVLGAPLMVLGMALLFAVEPGPNAALKVGAFFALASVGFTMVAVPYGAQAGEMTEDSAERSVMTAWRMGFAALGILLGGAVVPALAGAFGADRAVVMVAPVIIGAVWLSVFATCRAPRRARSGQDGWFQQIRHVIQNKAFSMLVLLYAVMTLAIAVMTAGLAYVALYLVQTGGPLAGAAQALGLLPVMFAAFTLGALCSQPLWASMSTRLGKLDALNIGLVAYALVLGLVWGALPMGLTLAVGLFVLVGLCNGAYQQIPWAMYPDLMDRTRARSGAALEGAHSAIWLLGQKAANALGPLILGEVLANAGWQATESGAAAQTEVALATLRAMVTLLPAALLMLALVGLWVIYRPALRAGDARDL